MENYLAIKNEILLVVKNIDRIIMLKKIIQTQKKIENNMFSLMCRIYIFKKDMKLDRKLFTKRKRTNRMGEGRQGRVAVRQIRSKCLLCTDADVHHNGTYYLVFSIYPNLKSD